MFSKVMLERFLGTPQCQVERTDEDRFLGYEVEVETLALERHQVGIRGIPLAGNGDDIQPVTSMIEASMRSSLSPPVNLRSMCVLLCNLVIEGFFGTLNTAAEY